MSWSGVQNLAEGLRAQQAFLASKVPSYARLIEILLSDLPSLEATLEPLWRERRFDAWYERPLLILGAVRHDAIVEGPTHPLYAAIASEPPSAEAVTPEAVAEALSPARERVQRSLAERAIQTNETSRAVAWMWVAHLLETAEPRRATALVDLGCSAGLNLIADALPSPWEDEHGAPIPTAPLPPIATRLGLDLRPLDALEPDTQAWLRACVWPGDTLRLERLDASLAALEAASRDGRRPVIEARSLDEAPARLVSLDADRVIAVQTIVRDYLPDAVKSRYVAGMREWIAGAPPRSAFWVELENRTDTAEPDRLSSLAVHFRPGPEGVQTLELARTHPHPRRLFVDGSAVAELAARTKE
jgi:hypothetical protein